MKILDLNENIEDVDEETLQHLFQNDYSEAYQRHKAEYSIYKGMDLVGPDFDVITTKSALLNPRKNRQSRNVPNIYTPIINESRQWSEYPKRNVICTTNPEYADAFGEVFIIFPINGSRIGICPDYDMFSIKTFDKLGQMYMISALADDVANLLSQASGFSDYESLMKSCEAFDNLGEEEKSQRFEKTLIMMPSRHQEKIIKDGLVNFLHEIINPSNFSLKSTSTFNVTEKDNREVWFDNKFLIVSEDTMHDYDSKVKDVK